jgi:hypothetical protein
VAPSAMVAPGEIWASGEIKDGIEFEFMICFSAP